MDARPLPTLAEIRAAVAGYEPAAVPPPDDVRHRASVAMMFAGPADALSLCFIRRAKREGDPWSGHMAFPGGRASADDPSPRAVAERETREEVGVALIDDGYIGPLQEISLHRIRHAGVLSPFVYWAGPELPPLVPEPGEVASAHWIGLDYVWDPANKTIMPWTHDGVAMKFPGIAFGDDVIWGLTYRVLTNLATLLERPLP